MKKRDKLWDLGAIYADKQMSKRGVTFREPPLPVVKISFSIQLGGYECLLGGCDLDVNSIKIQKTYPVPLKPLDIDLAHSLSGLGALVPF